MKRLALAVVAVISLAVVGCATSSYSVGKDFPSENVSKIVKGKTTGNELIGMLGEPFSKTVLSESEEKWIYTYSSGTASAQSYVFTTKVQTTGQHKMLDVLLKNGIVTNFTYTDRPEPLGSVQVQ
jgi:hypothetical protein